MRFAEPTQVRTFQALSYTSILALLHRLLCAVGMSGFKKLSSYTCHTQDIPSFGPLSVSEILT
jgi:hypothetical protein